ncbi:protein Bouncer [Parambassis ranga]|uniref:Protein Bouncer n=1 Tax=Parambassis ranga TaxID=210632 RepID=A0A6P7KK66_9TELE|nr:protein Bouncer-like [Parambassis ranga]
MTRLSTLPPAALLVLYFLLPSLVCDNLRCLYRPILEKDKTFERVVTECPPNELCFKGDGRYGNYSALSAKGCMAKKNCSQVSSIRLKGTVYTVTYTCCEWSYCNSCPVVSAEPLTLAMLVTLVVAGSL